MARPNKFVGSHSALSCFETCPYQFYRRYIKRDLPKAASPQIDRGNAVDKAIEARLSPEATPFPADMPYEKFVKPIIKNPGVHWVQQQLGITQEGATCGFFSENVWFRGKPDVVLFHGFDCAIIDWKTGNSAYENPSELERFAVLVAAKVPGLREISGVFAWLKDGRYGATFTFDPKLGVKKIREQMATIERAEKHGDWPATRNGLCKAWCDVLDCDHNGRKP